MSITTKILGGLGLAALLVLARRAVLTWGADGQEPIDALPGDTLVPEVSVSATRAITIDATPAEIWPWLAQIGWEHGGFYSYEKLENLFGLDIHNAVAVSDPWQRIEVGDEVHLAEKVALKVAQVVPEEYLVLLGAPPADGGASVTPFAFSWAFVLKPLPSTPSGDPRTRLIVRERYHATTPGARAAVEAVQPISFVMTQRMLRGIRDRAEGVLAAA